MVYKLRIILPQAQTTFASLNVAFSIFAPDLLTHFSQFCDTFAESKFVQIHFFVLCAKVYCNQSQINDLLEGLPCAFFQ